MGKSPPEYAIEIENLTLRFGRIRRRYGLKNAALHFFQYLRDRRETAWFNALDGISLKVRPGERIGVMGRNGSGKTTLLSVIGGVYRRYAGKCTVRGRVSMLLALGAGFNSLLSGRENIMLNGILQGKTRREMLALQDDIVRFADLGSFIDAPIYQYSSGMKARLGFAVATAIEPEILLVDEILAVGDSTFRKRCDERIEKLLAGGTTLVLVSHSIADIERHCTRLITLEKGKIASDVPVGAGKGDGA